MNFDIVEIGDEIFWFSVLWVGSFRELSNVFITTYQSTYFKDIKLKKKRPFIIIIFYSFQAFHTSVSGGFFHRSPSDSKSPQVTYYSSRPQQYCSFDCLGSSSDVKDFRVSYQDFREFFQVHKLQLVTLSLSAFLVLLQNPSTFFSFSFLWFYSMVHWVGKSHYTVGSLFFVYYSLLLLLL